MKYSRKDINKCISQALNLCAIRDKEFFVFATANGYTIASCKPPYPQDFYHISLRAGVKLHTHSLEAN